MKEDQPITDASVELVGTMMHEGMMPISGTGEHTEEGQFVVPLRWTMAGDWQVIITVELADGTTVEKTFDQQVIVTDD